MESVLAALAHSPGVLVATVLLLGLCVGSFLNVVAFRLPLMMEREWRRECRVLLEQTEETPEEPLTLSRPRSRCGACGAAIKPWHNIPVLGWLWLRGRCAGCRAPIPVQYPLVELASGLLAAACVLRFAPGLPLAAALVLVWTLLVLAVIDLRTQLLPDSITLPLLWLGLLLSPFEVFADPVSSIVGAAAGYLSLWSVYQAFRLATGKEGMGFGDFKLLAALGAWFGWQSLPLIVLLSSFVGALVGGALILLRRHGRDVPMPFGPFLAAAGLATLFGAGSLTGAWMRLAAPG